MALGLEQEKRGKRMRLLHIVPTYVPAYCYGGTIFSVHRLCRELARQGVDVEVYTSNRNGGENLAVKTGVKTRVDGVMVTYFPVKWLKSHYYMPKMLAAIRHGKFDLVHVHSVFNLCSSLGMRTCRKNNIPYLLSPRGMLEVELINNKKTLLKRAWIACFDKANYRGAQAVHFTSDRERDKYIELELPLQKFFVVPNGVEIATGKNSEKRERYLLYLGRINWKKNIDLIIKALSRFDDLELRIVGSDDGGEKKSLEILVAQLGLKDRVKFLGELYGKEKNEMLRQAFCLVLVSKSENFGNVVAEAMASETPVLVSEGVGLSDAIREHNAGLVVKPSVDEIVKAINKLDDAVFYNKLILRGRELVESEYSIATIVKKMTSHYQQIMHDKN